MNVTKHVLKDRKLHNEGYLGRVPAEQEEYPKASDHERITENNDFIMDLQTDRLLEMILARNNMNNAYFKVKSNEGVGGVDKMSVDELLPYLKENKDKLLEQLRLGKYKPQPVRRVEIPKEEKGKVRKLGIPTVVDRVIQQAIMQVLTPIYLQFIRGWLQYFKLADMKGILRKIDGWIRRRIRAVYWKQWKKIKTKYRMIRRYNLPEWKVHELANCRKGPWRAALMLNQIL